jgi:hypothetical protein
MPTQPRTGTAVTKPQRRQRGMRIDGYDVCSAGCQFRPRVCEFLFSVRLIEGSTRSDFPQATTASRAAPSTDSARPPAEFVIFLAFGGNR